METTIIFLVLGIILAYVYAFVSGFTDAANAIATSVGSRSLSPTTAVVMAGILETIGALTGTAVALTIGKGIVDTNLINLATVAAAILGTMTWSLLTYSFGIPVSETHGLIGGIIGAALAVAGKEVIVWSGLTKTLLAIIISPIAGFFGGLILMAIIFRVYKNANAKKAKKFFKNMQRLSSAFMAFSHGRNDAQKPMGILVMILAVYYGTQATSVPIWIILSVSLVAGIGVAYGGWRIIKTLGMKITALTPEQGFAAETAAAEVLQIASLTGVPVSTTHTITSSIIGAGVAKNFRSVRWGIALDIIISWILTLPATIAFGWIFSKAIQFFV